MNFKPTLWKSIISIIGGIFIIPYLIGKLFIKKPTGLEADTFSPLWTNILYIIIGVVLIYLIWSLIQKRK